MYGQLDIHLAQAERERKNEKELTYDCGLYLPSLLPSLPALFSANQTCNMVRVEVKGPQNNVRVRQLQVLAYPTKKVDSSLTPIAAQQKACEEEALRVFRLLTSQVHIL